MLQTIRKPEVSVIPATKRSAEGGGQIKRQGFLRVAAYCRVSTEDESQQTSYITQNIFYTQMISRNSGWSLAGIYADEAISGTSRTGRKDFNRMMDDAQKGKIDYIITKSISRFARNTVDTLNCVRQLRQLNPPVGIFFEKENIDTLDATGELILTILSALAQDESRSISDNIRWSIQRKFQRGEPIVDLNRMLGYDKGPNGEWVVNPEQAEIVRYIFEHFVHGTSANSIAKQLNKMEKKTSRGNYWRADSVLFVLRNEKYVGDLEMQKTITKNFLTHESVINHGEAPKYYVKNHHAGIVDRLNWEKAQVMLRDDRGYHDEKAAKSKKCRGSKASPFANLVCGAADCGGKLKRIGYNTPLPAYTDDRSIAAEGADPAKYKERYYFYYPVWRCNRNVRGKQNQGKQNQGKQNQGKQNQGMGKCSSGSIHECALEQSFMEMLYLLKRDYEEHGDTSQIVLLFKEACERMERRSEGSNYFTHRLEILDLQIKELEETLRQAICAQTEAEQDTVIGRDEFSIQRFLNGKKGVEAGYTGDAGYAVDAGYTGYTGHSGLTEDIRRRLNELKAERTILEENQSVTTAMRKNFDFFLRCLMDLPRENSAGMKMNVNGLDVSGSIFRDLNGRAIGGKRNNVKRGHLKITEEKMKQAPDLLNFEKGIYMAFIKNGVVKGSDVEYMTNFGVKLTSRRNNRTIGSFLGFRRANLDGTVEFLDENWKISGRGVCYVRKERG